MATVLTVPLLAHHDGREGAGSIFDVAALVGGKFNAVVNYLEKHGVKKLGSFKANATLVQRLVGEDGGMLAIGQESEALDVSVWKRVLQDEQTRSPVHEEDWNDDVTMDAFVLPLAGASLPDERGLLRHLVLQYNRGGCALQVFGLPAVQALITWKWSAYTRLLLFIQLAIFFVWLTAFTIFCVLIQDEDHNLTLQQLWDTRRGRAEISCEVAALAAMLPFVYIEVSTLISYGPSAWVNNWNVLDVVAYTAQVCITVLHLQFRHYTATTAFQALLAAQVVVLYMKLQYFTRVFHPGRPSFVDTMAAVFKDLGWFFVFYVMVVWAFALAFYTLFAFDQDKFEAFSDIWRSMVATFSALTGGMDYNDFLESSSPVLMALVYVMFQFCMVMVLSNLIMGFVVNGVSKVAEDEGLKQLLSKAVLIDETDSLMPAWVEARLPRHWFPRYIHVLKVNPRSVDKVHLDPEWPVQGASDDYYAEESHSGGGNGDGADGNSNAIDAPANSADGAASAPVSAVASLPLERQVPELLAQVEALHATVKALSAQLSKAQQQQQQDGGSTAASTSGGDNGAAGSARNSSRQNGKAGSTK